MRVTLYISIYEIGVGSALIFYMHGLYVVIIIRVVSMHRTAQLGVAYE